MAQVREFTGAIERAERRSLVMHALNARAATYDKRHFTDYLKKLDG